MQEKTCTDLDVFVSRIFVPFKSETTMSSIWGIGTLKSQGCYWPEKLSEILHYFRKSAKEGSLKSITMITPIIPPGSSRKDFMTCYQDRGLVQKIAPDLKALFNGDGGMRDIKREWIFQASLAPRYPGLTVLNLEQLETVQQNLRCIRDAIAGEKGKVTVTGFLKDDLEYVGTRRDVGEA